MILKILRYLSAYNEYCEVSVEGAYYNMKLRISNRESEPGTGNWFLVPYLSKRLGYFKIIDRKQGIGNREPGTGNRELVPCSLFWCVIPIFLKCKSGIRNQFPVPFNYNFVYTSFWLCLFHQHVRH